ncbi:MAG: hypothetical protein M5U28_29905 [Sandaracinaceae bacterium]|nr:hypothetical protein [Sandaracinaceae bacterium]
MSDDAQPQTKQPKTLAEDELTTERVVGRRSALGVIGVVLGAGGLSVLGAGALESEAEAQSDRDVGRYADSPAQAPRQPPRPPPRRARSGITDSDGGPGADPAGNGRGGRGGRSGCSDSDGGRFADPGGAGRRCGGGRRRCSDSDGGQYADPGGAGRRC